MAERQGSTEVNRREACLFGVGLSACALLPASAIASSTVTTPLSPKIIESQSIIAKAVVALRRAKAAVADYEQHRYVMPRNAAEADAYFELRNEEKAARNALHMAIMGGSVCVRPKNTADCDEQHRFLDFLNELHAGSSTHESTDGLREIIEQRRAEL